MKKLKVVLAIIIVSSTVYGQESFDTGFNEGFQATVKDALLSAATPPPPAITNCIPRDYSCGYREGVKAAAKIISSKKNKFVSSSTQSNQGVVFDFSNIGATGAALDAKPKITYVKTSPQEVNVKVNAIKNNTFEYVLLDDLYGDWNKRDIKTWIRSFESAGFKVYRNKAPVPKNYGKAIKLPKEEVLVCKWVRQESRTRIAQYVIDEEQKDFIKLQTMSGEILYEVKITNGSFVDFWFVLEQLAE